MATRSKGRLAADWFAKLRINAQTQEVEHSDVSEIKEEVDTSVASEMAALDSEKADLSYVDNAINNIEGVPTGVITMWSGSVSSVPAGWYLCNGSNGTPDLRGRFIYGASIDGDVNITGGSADAIVVSHTHTGPSHTHTSAAHTHSTPAHTHTASSNSTGAHVHGIGDVYGTSDTGTGKPRRFANASNSKYSTSAGAHSHTIKVNSGGASTTGSTTPGATGASGTGATGSTGSSGTNANLPPYMKLAYIMKG